MAVPNSDLDKAFELLQKGKSYESKGQPWQAAACFSEGRDLLQALADKGGGDVPDADKIVSLYQTKATEYLHHARSCLIEGMNQEKQKDEAAEAGAAPTLTSLSDEDAQIRTDVFRALFSKPVTPLSTSDIESRLLDLNASLPSGFKTSDERMKDISRGLNRLGLSSLFTQSQKPKIEEDLVPKSEEDQVAEIMRQAQDEVAADAQNPVPASAAKKAADVMVPQDTFDDISSSDSEDSEIADRKTLQSDNCDEIIAVLTIRKKIAKAQVQLAQSMALLEEAKKALDREEYEEDLGLTEQKESVVHLTQSKKMLRHAQRDLQKANNEWNESDLP